MNAGRQQASPQDGGPLFAVLGAGSWGTALAMQLTRAGSSVVLWDWDRAHIDAIARARCNEIHLPYFPLP